MSTCATCGAELKPEWKFCIQCGTPNPEHADGAEPVAEVVEVEPEDELEPEAEAVAEPVEAEPDAEPEPEYELNPQLEPVPAAIRPDPATSTGEMDPLAAIAIVIAIAGAVPAFVYGPILLLLPALAIVAGHLALARIRKSGARGKVFAIVATVLGYCWLTVWVVVLVDVILKAVY